MTPYGIVYKDNLYALEQSCLIWQKKYGVLRASAIIKPIAIEILFVFLINGVLFLINKDDMGFLVYTSVVMAVCFAFLTYFTFKTTYVRQLAKANIDLYQKQAVLFEDRIEFKSSYSHAVFYYDEIICWKEEAGILTIIIDKSTIPISVYSSCVGKGNYEKFVSLFKDKVNSSLSGKEGM